MKDVLIIGAGLAGASAALAACDAGLNPIVIEARSRSGGRAHSRAFDGEMAEYGGGWIRSEHLALRAMARRLGLTFRPRAAMTDRRYFTTNQQHSAPCSATERPAHDAAIAQLRHRVANNDAVLPPFAAGQPMPSLAAYFDQHDTPASARREIMAWWAISGSADPGKTGVDELFATCGYGDGSLDGIMAALPDTVDGGVTGLVTAALNASGAHVLHGDAVERLTQTPFGITAQTASGAQHHADAAVMALPLNTLHQIRFDPPLPPQQSALVQRGHQGRAIKLLIRATGVQPGILATGHSHGLRWLWSDHVRADGTTLIFAFGLADEVMPTRETVTRALYSAFPEARLAGYDWHDWITDPFARGTWVAPALGDSALCHADAWPRADRLTFASSDIAPAHIGWFEGAVLSGQAAIRSLLEPHP